MAAASAGDSLPGWSPGILEIHHISTGRGNCAFVIGPDATTFLIDAGDAHRAAPLESYYVSARPNGSRRPGQWIARYLRRQMARIGRAQVDTFLSTHLHGDHIGSVAPGNPRSSGGYQLTGIADVAEEIPVVRLIDRAWPTYDFPLPLAEPDMLNYRAFVRASAARGTKVERFEPGAKDQLTLRQNDGYPEFHIRNLAANGLVWTGNGTGARSLFPNLSTLSAKNFPTENMCSVAVLVHYGKFSYYTGGDMPWQNRYQEPAWRDVETPVAHAAGPVSVAVANHHGFLDACGPEWVKTLRPRAFVIQAWTSAHPTMPAIHNMLSEDLYAGPRAVFSTAVRPESRIAVREIDDMASTNGHVVLRVERGGKAFEVYVVSNLNESGHVVRRFGPLSAII